jgi:hypothetical protein
MKIQIIAEAEADLEAIGSGQNMVVMRRVFCL